MARFDSGSESTLRGLDEESRQMVVETVGQLRKRLLTPEKILEFDKKEVFPEAEIRELLGPDIGLQLLFIPEEYGGMGGAARDTCAVTRELGKICLGVATAFFAIQLGSDPILVGATAEQKERWLNAISDGNTLVAYAVTEPGAGSNLAALKTKADPVEDASGKITGYKLNGTKQFISTGGYADIVTVLAITPEGPSFFVVEKEMDGFERGKGEEKHGIRASNTSPLTFDDVYVPVENLIGGVPGQGLKQANQVFGYTRLMVAAMALGAGEAAMEIAIPYAQERIQFGSPLSEKQGYTHKLIVPHVVRLAAAAAYIDEVAHRLDATDEELQVEGSIAKLFTTVVANEAADAAIQALGGYGYITEFGVEKIQRDVRITRIYEGTDEIQQSIISTFRWKITRKSKGAYYDNIRAEMEDCHGVQDDLGGHLLALAASTLNDTIDLVHFNKLTRQQAAMFALADMMTYVEVGVSLVRKASGLTAEGAPDAEKYKSMARIFAGDVAQLVINNSLKILTGAGVLDGEAVSAFMNEHGFDELILGCQNVFKDMDAVADLVFER
jgi:alkylation response protein AidB-like acyl-CoA dehydrogenase